jgi:outer membrane protein
VEAQKLSSAQKSTLYPRLTFETRYSYTAVIPSINLPPPFPTVNFGSNNAYSIGPTLYYTIWDQGASRNTQQSFGLLAEAREASVAQEKQRILTATRAAYAKLQLSYQELQLVKESLALSNTQKKDVHSRFAAGAASQLEQVSSESDVLTFELRLAQATSEVRSGIFDLYAAINDLARAPSKIEDLQLDSLEQTLASFDNIATGKLDPAALNHNPGLRSQAKVSESADKATESQKAAYWPLIQMQARASLDYPNGPDLSQIQQKSIALTLSMPLYEFGRTGDEIDQKRATSMAAHYRQQQIEADLRRDFNKAQVQIQLLREQRKIASESVLRSEQTAKLNLQSYRAGRINITDVENANLRWLEARVGLTRVDAQLLNEMINLRALLGQDVASD